MGVSCRSIEEIAYDKDTPFHLHIKSHQKLVISVYLQDQGYKWVYQV